MTFPTTTRTPGRLAAAALGCLAAATLAGCGGNGLQSSAPGHGSDASTPSPTSHPTQTSSPTPTDTGHASSPASPASSAPPGPATCAPGDLAVDLQTPEGGGAAGSTYLVLSFANTSRTTCTMNGHPGVSFVGKHNGTQIGRPAVRTGSLRTVTLAPGESTTALLQVANAGNYDPDTCAPTTVDGFRVYPPDWRQSIFVAHRTQACQGDTGSSPQLSVSAVGRAGVRCVPVSLRRVTTPTHQLPLCRRAGATR